MNVTRIAGALLVGTTGTLYLQLRDDKPGIQSPGMISIFGGVLEDTENYIEGAIREIDEETGLRLDRSQLDWLVATNIRFSGGRHIDGEFFVVREVNERDLDIREGQLFWLEPDRIASQFGRLTPLTTFLLSVYLQRVSA